MGKRTFEVTFNDHVLDKKGQEELQRAIYVAVEEYLLYGGHKRDDLEYEEAEANLNLRVREEKWKRKQ